MAVTDYLRKGATEAKSLGRAFTFGASQTPGNVLFNIAGGAAAAGGKLAKDLYKARKTAGGLIPTAQAGGYSYADTQAAPKPYNAFENAPIIRGFTPTPVSAGDSGSTNKGAQSLGGYQVKGNETQSELSALRDMQLGQINDSYSEESKRLGDIEKRAKSAAGQAIAQAEAYYPEFQRLVGEQQTSTEGQIGGLENTRKYESERALGQARQLLNDLQRRQYAQMSATGNYGSSVPEAFADQFGNKAYAAQSQIQQSRDQSLNELAQKRVEAKQYFDTKLFEGKQKYDTLISGLKQQLNAQLDQIGQAKGQSSAAKRAGTLEAWNNYVNNKFSLDQELRGYQNQLTQYAAETESLADTSNNPFQGTAPAIENSNTNQIMGDQNAGLAMAPNASQGNYAIYPKKKVVDPLDPNSYQTNFQLNPIA